MSWPGDGGHCPTCGGRVAVVSAAEGTSHYVPLLDRATEVFACPDGHQVPYLLVHECEASDCQAQVVYVPHAVELRLLQDAQALARYVDWLLRGDWFSVSTPMDTRPMTRERIDALVATYLGRA